MITIYSVGHSNLAWADFQSLIEQHDIGVIVDVRSRPRSRLQHFNSAQLRVLLNRYGISYIWAGDRLGGISAHGASSYTSVASSSSFHAGIAQVLDIAGRAKAALLCAEHDALNCHRCLLIGRHLLHSRSIDVRHIHRDGTCEPHTEAEDRLLSRWDGGGDLFRTRVSTAE